MKFWNSKRMENYEFICYYIFKNIKGNILRMFFPFIENYQFVDKALF
jgi:hypothetical protein